MGYSTLTPSTEDYLEAIFVLEKKDGGARSIDVAHHLGVAKPSVNRALKNLLENGYIRQEKYALIYLTDEGRQIAEQIFFRHSTVKRFLTDFLFLDSEQAENEACKIEHVVSEVTVDRLRKLMIIFNQKNQLNKLENRFKSLGGEHESND